MPEARRASRNLHGFGRWDVTWSCQGGSVRTDPGETVACPRCVWDRSAVGLDAPLLLRLVLRAHYEIFHPLADPPADVAAVVRARTVHGAARVAERDGRRGVAGVA